MDPVVVLSGGGLNSTVAAACAARDSALHVLFADYGQPTRRRQQAAVRALAAALDAERTLAIDLPHVAQVSAVSTSADAKREPRSKAGARARAFSRPPGLMATLLLAGTQWALRVGAKRVICGASQLVDEMDNGTLPGEGHADYRVEFFHVFNMMLEAGLPRRRRLTVETPLIDLTRREIISLGARFQAPMHLAWVCQEDRDVPCGACPACQATLAELATAGVGTGRGTDRPQA